MATWGVDDVILMARQACPSLVYQTDGVDYYNRIDREIRFRVSVTDEAESVSLTAGTREYAMNEDTLRVWSARYQKSATVGDYDVLDPVSVNQLEADDPNFLKRANAPPKRFYVTENSVSGMVLGLGPAPDTTTSGGYPVVICRVSRSGDVANWTAAQSAAMPTGLVSYEAWAVGLCKLWARDFDPERYAFFAQAFEAELARLGDQRHTKNVQQPAAFLPNAVRRGRRLRV